MRIFYVEEECDADKTLKKTIDEKDVECIKCNSITEAFTRIKSAGKEEISVIMIKSTWAEQDTFSNNKLIVQTFGNFEVFYGDRPVAFMRAKSKELLAYLIDRRGATITTAEACGILWEGKEYNFSVQRQFQTVVSDLIKSLRKIDFEHLIHRSRNCLSVEVSEVECDYYKLLKGDAEAKDLYMGEYMTNYSWAELTAGFLAQKYH
ncbi:MAG: hypothetical protein IJ336_09275 [Lachnospiraceae bacterium]|nr:hypothetical protein [Lachnospiraceae bacterium]